MDSIVLNNWLHNHFPAVSRLAEELQRSGTKEPFVYMAHVRSCTSVPSWPHALGAWCRCTTGRHMMYIVCTLLDLLQSWLISLALDCPPNIGIRCPSAAEVEALEAAIRQGTITWHGACLHVGRAI